ncbi:MAG: hypothetical protein PGN16_08420 [Sphingomonas phyllosphaerae]|uniref:hypothetical protein n=1 Tax=Sphingomonas phyllosphaerae TaxID=257003 RepID=UPI002FF520C7
MADETKPAVEAGEQDDVRARAVAEAEAADAEVPTPTQAELDAAKRGEPVAKAGGYRTRQAKAN